MEPYNYKSSYQEMILNFIAGWCIFYCCYYCRCRSLSRHNIWIVVTALLGVIIILWLEYLDVSRCSTAIHSLFIDKDDWFDGPLYSWRDPNRWKINMYQYFLDDHHRQTIVNQHTTYPIVRCPSISLHIIIITMKNII